jgi:hypothetical protein
MLGFAARSEVLPTFEDSKFRLFHFKNVGVCSGQVECHKLMLDISDYFACW